MSGASRATFRQYAASTLKAACDPTVFNKRASLWGRRTQLVRRAYESLWSFSTMWSAICTIATLPEPTLAQALLGRLVPGLSAYHHDRANALTANTPIGFESMPVFPRGHGGEIYYDDNAWIALAVCRQHEILPASLTALLSRRILSFLIDGWTADRSPDKPGGISWKVSDSNCSRNACSNAPVAQVAALIAIRDHDATSLAWAQRVYHWVRGALANDDGLYRDRIDSEGNVAEELWSYNQGTMIGAGVLLWRATQETQYLSQATATANAALEHWSSVDALTTQGPVFNAVLLRNLLFLEAAGSRCDCRDLFAEYVDRLWSESRNPASGLITENLSFLNGTAAMAELCALLGGGTPHP